MTPTQQHIHYLDEHLPYMLKMVRYTFEQMQHKRFYLDWNAKFESFSVRARNLVNFLTNHEDRRNNFQAHQFVASFRARKADITEPMNMLEEQVFHLDKRRPKDNKQKFNTDHANVVFEWIEAEMKKFVRQLPAELRPYWKDENAIPESESDLITTEPQSACTVFLAVQNQTTSSISAQNFVVSFSPTNKTKG